MIIWRGLGFLVAVIVFGFSLAANLISNVVGGEGYWDQHRWLFSASLICSAVVCWFLGSYLKKRSDRIAIDKQTGEEIVVNQSKHTLFFIPMHWWAPILAATAVALLAVEFLA
jgi:hypothetical protein